MTSEDIAASVVLPSVETNVIPSQSTGDENSKNSLDTSVIKRRSMETVPGLTKLKEHRAQNSVAKPFLIESKGESGKNLNDKGIVQGNLCTSHASDYFNSKLFERAYKSSLGFNQFCKSYNPLKQNNVCTDSQIPAVLTEINFKADASSVEGQALKGHLIVNDHCTDAATHILTLHKSNSNQKSGLGSSSSNNQCILSSHLETLRGNCCNSCVSSSCSSESCGNSHEHIGLPMNYQSNFCPETMPEFLVDNADGQTLPCNLSSQPFQTQDSDEQFEEGKENDFSRIRRDRSTLLIRRFCKNYKEVKKSIYTGTSAVFKSLPSGHIGTKAVCFVKRNKENTKELRYFWITAKSLTFAQGFKRRDNFLFFLETITICQKCCIVDHFAALDAPGMKLDFTCVLSEMNPLSCVHTSLE